MFTPENYFEKIQGIDFSTMPEAIREGHALILDFTGNDNNWEDYYESAGIKEMVDIYFTALQKQVEGKGAAKKRKAVKPPAEKPPKKTVVKKQVSAPVDEATAKAAAKDLIRSYVLRGETVSELNKSYLASANDRYEASIRSNKIRVSRINNQPVEFTFSLPIIYKEIQQEQAKSAPQKNTVKVTSKQKKVPAAEAKPVERIDEAMKFIKRYVQMHGKVKTKEQILNFINALQKAILEKRIRKTSDYAEQIIQIQNSLVKLYNKMDKDVEIQLRDPVLRTMMEIAGAEKVRWSVAYLKRYIGMQGKQITKEKAEKLLNLVAGALDKGKIPAGDPYMERMKRVMGSLRTYLRNIDKEETLHIHEATLNGIQRALDKCNCGSLHGLQGAGGENNLPPETVMNSMDFVKMKFDTLGFTGKWLKLIGDPSSNFTAMIFGKPKMGKSYLCVDFAGYLARQHGKVLYVAKEESLDYTLQEKLNDKNVQHPNLYVTGNLPADLSMYDFIFLDSVNRMGLSPEDLRQLKAQYPAKSFVYIFQSTKQGAFRGENSFQHDVDVVIEVPEKGKAVQMGRFNQGGEMEIFNRAV